MSEPERRVTLLGVVTVQEGEATPVFDIPLDADPNVLAKPILQAEEEKARRKLAESERLRRLFLKDGADG
jgi:hypothetical protein